MSLITGKNYSLDNITIRQPLQLWILVHKQCIPILEPPTLSLLSGSISNTHQGQVNVSICEIYTDDCESEPTEKHERDQKPDNVQTNEAVP